MAESVNLPGAARTASGVSTLISQVVVSGALTDTPIVAYTVPASLPFQGSMYRFTAFGNTDNTAAANTFNFWLKNNAGTKVATQTFTTAASALTVQPWRIEFLLTYRLSGTGGTFVVASWGQAKSPTFAAAAFPILDQTTTTAQDTTVSHAWTLGMNWTAAVTGNILRADHAAIELVKI